MSRAAEIGAVVAVKLGLIGIGISRSRAPQLHRLAGELCGLHLSYDLLEQQSSDPVAFDSALWSCREQGFRGVNVTYPFKERAAQVVQLSSPQLRQLGAVNTIRFDASGQAHGFNTDYIGFKRAFQSRFHDRRPGVVAVVGSGGVGRAIAFGLIDLRASEIRLYDQAGSKAKNVAAALSYQSATRVVVCNTLEEATAGADGLINATPQGMHQYPQTAIPPALIDAQRWAFDAVYTPPVTQFLSDAQDAGLEILWGYELFFFQGVDAFEIFTGRSVNLVRLREALEAHKLNHNI